jgi:hypothetical protein
MGIYCFSESSGRYIKVGHYIKSNAWSRVANRGFRSCKCPPEIKGAVMCCNLELEAWYPSLCTKDEKLLHRTLKAQSVCGEWYNLSSLPTILTYLNEKGVCDMSLCDKKAAQATRRRL